VRTLDNYFDDWIRIRISEADIHTYKTWCRENFGYQGLLWDVGYDERIKSYLFRFKNDDAALMFKLKFDGNSFITQ
jgi:hypothetical protein